MLLFIPGWTFCPAENLLFMAWTLLGITGENAVNRCDLALELASIIFYICLCLKFSLLNLNFLWFLKKTQLNVSFDAIFISIFVIKLRCTFFKSISLFTLNLEHFFSSHFLFSWAKNCALSHTNIIFTSLSLCKIGRIFFNKINIKIV